MKEKKQLLQDHDLITNAIHNLVWFRITRDEKYLDLVPDDGRIQDPWIHVVNCQFIDIDDTVVRAVVEINAKYYQYTFIPLLEVDTIVCEIPEPKVEVKLNEFGGNIWKGFEEYGPILKKKIDAEEAEDIIDKNVILSDLENHEPGVDLCSDISLSNLFPDD